MKKLLLIISILFLSQTTQAALITWQLQDFSFDDGGTAYGSFVYDTDSRLLSNIDIHTTNGSRVGGRDYVATAGQWGNNSNYGILAFTDTSSTVNYFGAGWLRMDFHSIYNVTNVGVSLNQWIAVGAESYCANSVCSSAANEITDPENSRETVSGYILSTQSINSTGPVAVPLPGSIWLFLSGLLMFKSFGRKNS
jgi:hypothetical protein